MLRCLLPRACRVHSFSCGNSAKCSLKLEELTTSLVAPLKATVCCALALLLWSHRLPLLPRHASASRNQRMPLAASGCPCCQPSPLFAAWRALRPSKDRRLSPSLCSRRAVRRACSVWILLARVAPPHLSTCPPHLSTCPPHRSSVTPSTTCCGSASRGQTRPTDRLSRPCSRRQRWCGTRLTTSCLGATGARKRRLPPGALVRKDTCDGTRGMARVGRCACGGARGAVRMLHSRVQEREGSACVATVKGQAQEGSARAITVEGQAREGSARAVTVEAQAREGCARVATVEGQAREGSARVATVEGQARKGSTCSIARPSEHKLAA
eukprot:365632-Chlamydomonas_euryale.AAC.13